MHLSTNHLQFFDFDFFLPVLFQWQPVINSSWASVDWIVNCPGMFNLCFCLNLFGLAYRLAKPKIVIRSWPRVQQTATCRSKKVLYISFKMVKKEEQQHKIENRCNQQHLKYLLYGLYKKVCLSLS